MKTIIKTIIELFELVAIFLTVFAAIIGTPLLMGYLIGKGLGAG